MSKQAGLGFWTLTFLVVANMIGAGVFTTSGYTLASLHNPSSVVLAWVIGGLIALCGAYSYGRLVAAMPESGGEYLFLSQAAHPLLGFVAGWVSMIAGFTGAIAFAATAFESYTYPANAPEISWLPRGSVAIAVIVACGLLHSLLPKGGSLLQNLTVGIKLTLIAGFLVFALTKLNNDTWQGQALAADPMTPWETFTSFCRALIWISFSYSGFNAAVYVAGEVESARQKVPRALLTGTAVVTVVYVLLNAVFVYTPPPEVIVAESNIATVANTAAKHLGGTTLANFVRALIAVALLTSVSSMMMAAPRVYARMADDGFLPAALRFKTHVPTAAVILQVVLGVFMVSVYSTLRDLLDYLGLTLSLCAALSVGCLFLPTVRNSSLFSLKLLPPLLFILAVVTTATFSTIDRPLQLAGVVLTFSVGTVLWFCLRKETRPT